MFVYVLYQQALLFIHKLLCWGFHLFKDGCASLIDSSRKGVKIGAERVEYDREGLLKWRGAGAIGEWEYLRISCQFNNSVSQSTHRQF